jgi:formate dehydrogenase iron-sulfur subunit
MSYAILYDSTRCVQCEGCVNACLVKNDLPDDADDRLSEHRFSRLEDHGGHPVRRVCMHCEEPACASVCPVGALQKTKDGPVTYDPDKCMGCRYCMVACPFGVPKYEWSKAIPRVRKCQMCFDRVEDGKKPACTMFCPADAIRFGDRDELLAEAKARMAKEPDRYHPHVYGEKEVGGTGVMIIAAVPPEELGLPVNLPTDPLPLRTWNVLSRLPGVVAVGASFCLGMWWLINRRDRLHAEKVGAERELDRAAVGDEAVENVEVRR